MSDETTRRVPLGECDCPEQPHAEGDEAVLKKGEALKYGVIRRVGAAMASEGGDPLEGGISMAVLMVLTIVSWNKVRRDPRGRDGLVALPITLDAIDGLSPIQSRALISVLNEPAYMDHFLGPRVAAQEAGEAPAVDAAVESVQTAGDAEPPAQVSEPANGIGLVAPPPPNPSSGSSPDGSAAPTPSTTSSALPAPI